MKETTAHPPPSLEDLPISIKLLLIGILVGFFAFIIFIINSRGFFEYAGIDYKLWYSSGMIARQDGFALIYNIAYQTQYQQQLVNSYGIHTPMSMPFLALPMPYLSVFVLPMVLFSLLEPLTGFALWTIINLLGIIFYTRYFIQQSHLQGSRWYFWLLMAAPPVIFNLLFGQVNLLLLVAVGQTILLMRKNQEFFAGFWLAGMLIKPQTLLLLILLLILFKKKKELLGFCAGAGILVGISFLLTGNQTLIGPLNIIRNEPAQFSDSGMNLMSFAVNITKFLPQTYATIFIALVTVFIVFLTIKWWLSIQAAVTSDLLELCLLVTLAVTCSISPHSNIHMALPMLLPGMVALAKRQIPRWLALTWALAPSTVFLLIAPLSVGGAHAMLGTTMLLVNLSLLFWVDLKGRAEFTTKLQEPEREGDS